MYSQKNKNSKFWFQKNYCKLLVNFFYYLSSISYILSLSAETESMAKSIIVELLETVESYKDLSKHIIHGLAERITQDIQQRSCLPEVVNNLIAFLPFDPTDEEQTVIEFAAEKLFSLQQIEVSHIVYKNNL